jgi:hypothetical protein
MGAGLIPFAIKNLLNGERCFGGGQPCGLAAASAWGRRPPSAGGGPTKYHRLAFKNSLQTTRRGDLFLLALQVGEGRRALIRF